LCIASNGTHLEAVARGGHADGRSRIAAVRTFVRRRGVRRSVGGHQPPLSGSAAHQSASTPEERHDAAVDTRIRSCVEPNSWFITEEGGCVCVQTSRNEGSSAAARFIIRV